MQKRCRKARQDRGIVALFLDRRRARVPEGAAQLLDWESVKGTME
jgi:hypothetical protein